jgi:hypothetical protein
LFEETRNNLDGAIVVSMLTGAFLSPYLLSSGECGAGMMKVLSKIPVDYLTWGNHHGADTDHTAAVCRPIQIFLGSG